MKVAAFFCALAVLMAGCGKVTSGPGTGQRDAGTAGGVEEDSMSSFPLLGLSQEGGTKDSFTEEAVLDSVDPEAQIDEAAAAFLQRMTPADYRPTKKETGQGWNLTPEIVENRKRFVEEESEERKEQARTGNYRGGFSDTLSQYIELNAMREATPEEISSAKYSAMDCLKRVWDFYALKTWQAPLEKLKIYRAADGSLFYGPAVAGAPTPIRLDLPWNYQYVFYLKEDAKAEVIIGRVMYRVYAVSVPPYYVEEDLQKVLACVNPVEELGAEEALKKEWQHYGAISCWYIDANNLYAYHYYEDPAYLWLTEKYGTNYLLPKAPVAPGHIPTQAEKALGWCVTPEQEKNRRDLRINKRQWEDLVTGLSTNRRLIEINYWRKATLKEQNEARFSPEQCWFMHIFSEELFEEDPSEIQYDYRKLLWFYRAGSGRILPAYLYDEQNYHGLSSPKWPFKAELINGRVMARVAGYLVDAETGDYYNYNMNYGYMWLYREAKGDGDEALKYMPDFEDIAFQDSAYPLTSILNLPRSRLPAIEKGLRFRDVPFDLNSSWKMILSEVGRVQSFGVHAARPMAAGTQEKCRYTAAQAVTAVAAYEAREAKEQGKEIIYEVTEDAFNPGLQVYTSPELVVRAAGSPLVWEINDIWLMAPVWCEYSGMEERTGAWKFVDLNTGKMYSPADVAYTWRYYYDGTVL